MNSKLVILVLVLLASCKVELKKDQLLDGVSSIETTKNSSGGLTVNVNQAPSSSSGAIEKTVITSGIAALMSDARSVFVSENVNEFSISKKGRITTYADGKVVLKCTPSLGANQVVAKVNGQELIISDIPLCAPVRDKTFSNLIANLPSEFDSSEYLVTLGTFANSEFSEAALDAEVAIQLPIVDDRDVSVGFLDEGFSSVKYLELNSLNFKDGEYQGQTGFMNKRLDKNFQTQFALGYSRASANILPTLRGSSYWEGIVMYKGFPRMFARK
jgi:hypothetical protein